MFMDKTLKEERITLGHNNKFVLDESELLDTFSKYFEYIVQNLRIDGLTNISSDNNTSTIRIAIDKYQNYPSIR